MPIARALCVQVILGSETHYSNPVWVVICEKQICQCFHLYSNGFHCYICLFGTRSYLPSHPTGYDVANCGKKSEQVFIFYWSTPMLLINYWKNVQFQLWKECQFQISIVFKNLERNAKLGHLALPTMLSALKHDWAMLALTVVVNWSQPNHARLTICIEHRNLTSSAQQ